MRGYFVEDTQGPYFLQLENWGLFNTQRDIVKIIRSFGDFHDSCESWENCSANECAISKLPNYAIFDIWGFRPHRATPSNFAKFGYSPGDIASDHAAA